MILALLTAAGILLFVIAGPQGDEKPVFRPEWAACADDDSCVAVRAPCGWEAVNGRHKEDAELYYGYLATVIEVRCGQEDVPAEPPVAKCRASRCTFE